MSHPMVEAAVESREAAIAAERAGVARVELCVRLDEGGTTPSVPLMKAAIGALSIPVFVMIRPRAGDFCYSGRELAQMHDGIAAALDAGARGVVLGALTSDGRVDIAATRALVDAAHGLPVTFHRAFDEAEDLARALEDVIHAGVARVLTSGGGATASAGADMLAKLVRDVGDRITIVGAGGIRAHNVADLVRRTGLREVHARFEDEPRTHQLVERVGSISL